MKSVSIKLASYLILASFVFISTLSPARVPSFSSNQSSDVQPDSLDGKWFANQVKEHARNDPATAVNIAETALRYFEKSPDAVSKATVLNESSYALYFLGRYTEAMQRAKNAEVHAKNNQLEGATARSKVLQGNVFQAIGVYDEALSHYQEAASYYRQQNNKIFLGRVFNNIANTYLHAAKPYAALDFYRQSGEIATTDRDQAKMYLGFANTYEVLGEPENAIQNFYKALELYKKTNDQLGQELVSRGLGYSLLEQGKPKEAIELFEQTLISAKKGNRLFREANTLHLKARALLELGDFELALTDVDRSIKLALETDDKENQKLGYRMKSQILEELGKHSQALELYKTAVMIERDFINSRANTQLSVMQAKFDLEKKNHQIDLLQSENALQLLKIEQQRVISLAVIGSLLFAAAIIFFLFYRRTQRKLLLDHKQVSERLKELDKVKNQVMANTSHELRTPLNGIIGMTQVLLDESNEGLSEENADYIKVIENCGQRLLSLVQDITDFSQLQAGKLKLKVTAVDLETVVEQVYSLLAQLAGQKGLELKTQLPLALPPVSADPERLNQVLLNLVGNSIKFSDKGSIYIIAKKVDAEIKITIKDQGIGIPEEELLHIFEPFEQVDGSSTRTNEGSGLGLPITRELLHLHNSILEVNSILGVGTEFSFSLAIAEYN
ncbi:tetratricopeptide repeat protein [Aliikangiella coralliicola]|uniref:histidine kinase n=1 Tax=Aliikangiella coralliicola TaxID=2592383 RepID=A0A545U8K2_9GAMM|nr:tetratricopeptide repeat protein [Aliikangiella coralliicola]TQV85800.1 tetratricopeptide repeat protein [Aliikangiella coralliicola]